jgi:hypothetical protein
MLYNVFFIIETLINKLVRVWMCVGGCGCVGVGGWVCWCDFFKNSLHNFELIRRT